MSDEVSRFFDDVLESATGIPGLGLLVERVRVERAQRLSRALSVAEALTGYQRERLEEWAARTPGTMDLTVRVLMAAGLTGNDDTLKVLGGLLAEAIENPGRSTSEQELIVDAIEGLTREQLAVLVACVEGGPQVEDIRHHLGQTVSWPMVEPILVGLFTRGLLLSPYGAYGGNEQWRLSPLGDAVHAAADRVRQV